MEKVGFIVDSGTDIPKDIIEKYNIKVVPLRIIINGKEYEEGTISEEFLIERLNDSEVKTSLPNPEKIEKAIKEFINSGIKKILTFNISGSMSGTYNLFRLVSNKIKEEYTDVEIENIDTLNISIGAGLVAYRSIKMLEEGKSFEEVALWGKENAKKSKIFFVIPTLQYLAKGGRIGKVSAKIGELLNIKPIISNSDEGIYYTVTKVRGLKKAYKRVYNEFLKFVDNNKYLAAVYISGASKEIEKLQNDVYKKIMELENTMEVFVGKLSSTLLVHAGPDMYGIGAIIVD
ncbi:EDD domain protein, DegV family [Marinitoga hydrogenitolerans DSM 16785]|uniref:EDD domain protein, DegV family n=1 Tax=Marinitoga hydrogenitolerans (strain DSM 16785 / JCM 12826 / AT1271) TaxID=1122195 RepID=A0A1M4UHC1_MARH1|nr:DegV family protein [Marinitoga hydrogenitolerans]SHE56146.1 EDD domain protein, DegV family [Marinitoga hydrogenitolerans DSM 16785]